MLSVSRPKDVQSNEDEAKVEHVHVEAKEVVTASLALVSTAQVLGTPEQHTCGDQSLDLNTDGVQIALQLEIWATRRRPIVLSEAKSLQQADAEAHGSTGGPRCRRCRLSDYHLRCRWGHRSDNLMALGEEVSNNRHISEMIAWLATAVAFFFLLRIGSLQRVTRGTWMILY